MHIFISNYYYSGGHLNPAITIGVFIAGGLNAIAAVLYFIAQIIGGIVGASFVMVSRCTIVIEDDFTQEVSVVGL